MSAYWPIFMMMQKRNEERLLCALTRLLTALRVAAITAQTNHWACAGENYYSDHLLFQRIYQADDAEIDGFAERAIAFAGPEAANPVVIAYDVAECLADLAYIENRLQRQLTAERCVISCAQALMDVISRRPETKLGWDDVLGAIVSKREEHEYLLKRRLT
jgi:DNA-binding ferritin-like protein